MQYHEILIEKEREREGRLPLPLAFQYLAMISSLDSKGQDFKLRARGLQFHFIKWLKNGHFNFLRTCHFEASKDIMTKFKSQALHTARIKY